MKKTLLVLVCVVLFGLSAHTANAIQPKDIGLKEGDVISAHSNDGDPDVYIVNDHFLGARKRVFINEAIFGMYGHLGFNKIRPVTAAQRDMFPTSNLFKVTGSEKVYCLEATGEDTGRLNWISVTGEQAIQQNPAFFANVFTISTTEFNWYEKGPTLYSVNDCKPYARGGRTANYSITVPNGWLSTEKNLRRGLVFRATNLTSDVLSSNATNFATMDMSAHPTYGNTMQQQVQSVLQWYQENLSNFQKLQQTSTTVSGYPAELLKVTYDEVDGVKTTQYVLITLLARDEVVYTLTLGSATETWAKYDALYLGVISSLTVKGSTDAGYVALPISPVTPTPVPYSGFTAQKPSGWEEFSDSKFTFIFATTPDVLANGTSSRATISGRKAPASGFDAHQNAQFQISKYQAIMPQYTLLSNESLTIQGYDAHLLQSTYSYNGLRVREYQLIIVGGDYNVYGFTGIAAEEVWPKYEKLFRDTVTNLTRI
mgnify:CR=1 FL=1